MGERVGGGVAEREEERGKVEKEEMDGGGS